MRPITMALTSSIESNSDALACARMLMKLTWYLLEVTCSPDAGYLFCNGPTFNATVGERVRFYLMTLGSEADLHNPNLITSQWTALVRRLHIGYEFDGVSSWRQRALRWYLWRLKF